MGIQGYGSLCGNFFEMATRHQTDSMTWDPIKPDQLQSFPLVHRVQRVK
jgi:hypothetical protein